MFCGSSFVRSFVRSFVCCFVSPNDKLQNCKTVTTNKCFESLKIEKAFANANMTKFAYSSAFTLSFRLTTVTVILKTVRLQCPNLNKQNWKIHKTPKTSKIAKFQNSKVHSFVPSFLSSVSFLRWRPPLKIDISYCTATFPFYHYP